MSRGIRALACLAGFGTVAAGFAAVTLFRPGTGLDAVWRLNPEGHAGLLKLGGWAVLLMAAVSLACGLVAWGLWTGRPWARVMAIAGLAINLVADTVTAVVRHRAVTLIGVPIALTLIVYLRSPGVRRSFEREVVKL